jgi:hypothetical protein
MKELSQSCSGVVEVGLKLKLKSTSVLKYLNFEVAI